jgi:hypothetical protein
MPFRCAKCAHFGQDPADRCPTQPLEHRRFVSDRQRAPTLGPALPTHPRRNGCHLVRSPGTPEEGEGDVHAHMRLIYAIRGHPTIFVVAGTLFRCGARQTVTECNRLQLLRPSGQKLSVYGGALSQTSWRKVSAFPPFPPDCCRIGRFATTYDECRIAALRLFIGGRAKGATLTLYFLSPKRIMSLSSCSPASCYFRMPAFLLCL